MKNLLTIISRGVVTLVILVVACVPGSVAFAEEAVCNPPTPTENGVRWPTGSDAGTFTYVCEGAYAGKWINAYYLYNPQTNTRSALYSPDYSYDCDAKQWFKTTWDFSPASGSYYKATVLAADPGGIATNCPVPDPPAQENPEPSTTATGSTDGTGTSTGASFSAGPNGTSGSTVNGTNNVGVQNGTTATMRNGIISFADTGEALVTGNTTAGNAASGDAQVIANIINMLQSSSNVLGGPNMLTFTADINGDVNGDLLLDPSSIGSVQPANSSTTLDNNFTVNNSTDAAIVNNIDLAANTGDAGVIGNTNAGNAASGTANAVANVVNVLNSAITAGQSFVGVININGNLNGDILLPPNFIDTLLASNVPRYTISTAAINSDVNITNNTNQSIYNAVDALATTGNASVLYNTSAGNATSGTAHTNLTIFNVTGSNLIASNNLLVFVNVLGAWYGLIMNAPAGTTAASLGGGVTNNTTVNNTANLTNDTNQSITNNIRVASTSGDATVAENTRAGNASSGDASASINLMNMINSALSLNGWFGLLFINVFGTWNGSFGVDTAAGDPTTSTPSPAAQTFGNPFQVFRFVPKSINSNGSGTSSRAAPITASVSTGASTTAPVALPQAVLAASNTGSDGSSGKSSRVVETLQRNFLVYVLGGVLALAILVFGERSRFFHR